MRGIVVVTSVMILFTSVARGQESLDTTSLNVSVAIDSIPGSSVPYNWMMNEKHHRKTQFVKSLYVSMPLIALGIMGTTGTSVINKYEIKEERDEHFAGFNTNIDDYLIYAPIAALYGMNALGYKGVNTIGRQSVLLLKSEIIMNALVFPLKSWTNVQRPDGKDFQSFPSGHAAQAFLSAELLRKEYGKTHPWLAVTGYLAATSVAAFRMMNNRHWAPDVLAGAGIGILSVNLAYLTQKSRWPLSTKNLQVSPTYTGNGPGMYVSYHFGNRSPKHAAAINHFVW